MVSVTSAPENSEPKRQRHDRDHRDERVAQRVMEQHARLAGALGAGGADIVLAPASRSSPRARSADAAETGQRQRRHRQDQMRERGRRAPPSPTVAMPPAGSQPSAAAKTRISISASQKDGTETPAKLKRLTAASKARAGPARRGDAERPARAPAPARSSPHQQRGVAEPRQQHLTAPARRKAANSRNRRRAPPRAQANSARQRPVEAVERLEPRRVGRGQMRVGRDHQVDRIARHQPDQRIDDERHRAPAPAAICDDAAQDGTGCNARSACGVAALRARQFVDPQRRGILVAGRPQALEPFRQDEGVGAEIERQRRQFVGIEALQPRPTVAARLARSSSISIASISRSASGFLKPA